MFIKYLSNINFKKIYTSKKKIKYLDNNFNLNLIEKKIFFNLKKKKYYQLKRPLFYILNYKKSFNLILKTYFFLQIYFKLNKINYYSYILISFSKYIFFFILLNFNKNNIFIEKEYNNIITNKKNFFNKFFLFNQNEIFKHNINKNIYSFDKNYFYIKNMSWFKFIIQNNSFKFNYIFNTIKLNFGESITNFHKNISINKNFIQKIKYSISSSPKKKELLLQTFVNLNLKQNWVWQNQFSILYYLPITLGFRKFIFFSSNNFSKIGDITSGLSCIENIFEARYSIYSFPVSEYIGIILCITKQNFEESIKIFSLKFACDFGLKSDIFWFFGNHLEPLNILIKKTEIVYGGFILSNNKHSFNIISKNYFQSSLIYNSLYNSTKYTFIYCFNLILESLIKQYNINGIYIHSIFFELIIKRMISCVKINNNFDSTFSFGDKIKFTIINLINTALNKHGYSLCKYTPIILGITNANLACSGFLSSVSFQNTTKILLESSIKKNTDWFSDLKSQIMVSELIFSGSGWYRKFNFI